MTALLTAIMNAVRALATQLTNSVTSINNNTNTAVSNARGGPNLWVSGVSVPQGAMVVSPLDGEVYRRLTASGSGATDPANDLTNYLAVSYRRVTALSATVFANGTAAAGSFANGATKVAINLAVGTRGNLLNISGRGAVQFLGLTKASTNGGQVEIYADGRTLFNDSVAPNNQEVAVFVGAFSGTTPGSTFVPAYYAVPAAGIEFKRSLQVYYTPATTSATVGALAYIVRGSE
ncbi:hypothetical protein [Comamonas sp. JUb58]|uniref:hypothetical protein n=1 Tax=Comamonas sp. JUb58 TaxID=2485114 RepID=UPI00105B7BDC|nr:hypothetical protein [Comamonas sp. JUb58]TDS74416.1 hypothetical protein EDF71_11796 [Comamonas sp. JUb58]